MKNVTNLEIKRQRVGLIKELSAFAVVGVYKKASMKTKLELIGLIEVLKHTEKNYRVALDLIFKFEKVNDSTQLISILSKNHLEAKVLSDVERLAMVSKTPPKRNKKDVPVTQEPSYYEKHKTIILVMSGFIGMLLLLIIIKPSSNTNKPTTTIVKSKQENFIRLTPRNGHKFIYTSVNGISTTFMLDTGASTSTVSTSFLNKHIRSGFINRRSHFKRNGIYYIANGESVIAEVWKLPSMRLGNKTIYNVEVAVMPGIDDNGFLLGMSTINKLGNPKIDLANNKIVIN
jgi:clan AA aspartic protease (TIGR02281 family)